MLPIPGKLSLMLEILLCPVVVWGQSETTPSTRGVRSAVSRVSARVSLPPLLIESLAGPVTAAEMAAFQAYVEAAPAASSNLGNAWVYGSSGRTLEAICLVYEFSRDVPLLDRAIFFADTALACRNDATNGRVLWSGKRELCWPNKAEGAPDARYSGSENGDVVAHIGNCARLILMSRELWDKPVPLGDPHHFGVTYRQRALTYIRELDRTIDTYILPHFVARDTLRLYWPTAPSWKALGSRYAGDSGRPIPWNQQMMLTGGFQRLAECHELLGDAPERVTRYDAIVKAAMDWFLSQLHTHTVDGHICYQWSYAVNDTDLRYMEDSGHAGYDVMGICRAARRERYGIPEEALKPFVNTVLHALAQPGGLFARRVDGTVRPKEAPRSLNGTWLELSPLSPELFDRVAKASLPRARTNIDTVSRILWMKDLNYKRGQGIRI